MVLVLLIYLCLLFGPSIHSSIVYNWLNSQNEKKENTHKKNTTNPRALIEEHRKEEEEKKKILRSNWLQCLFSFMCFVRGRHYKKKHIFIYVRSFNFNYSALLCVFIWIWRIYCVCMISIKQKIKYMDNKRIRFISFSASFFFSSSFLHTIFSSLSLCLLASQNFKRLNLFSLCNWCH